MKVFVYGTLLAGERNHRALREAPFLGTARTTPGWALVDWGPYPAMVAGDGAVEGEVYAVDAATLARLDALEGEPYRRVGVILDGGGEAQAYVMPAASVAHLPRIASGSWRRR